MIIRTGLDKSKLIFKSRQGKKKKIGRKKSANS